MEVTPERYAAEIAFARTFGWEYDLNQMRNMGLIRGASLENAVCFTGEGVLNPEGLRFAGRVLPPQGAGSDRRPGAAGPPAAGPRHRRARRPCHARRAGGAHHVGPLSIRDPHLGPTGLARDPGTGLLKYSAPSRSRLRTRPRTEPRPSGSGDPPPRASRQAFRISTAPGVSPCTQMVAAIPSRAKRTAWAAASRGSVISASAKRRGRSEPSGS